MRHCALCRRVGLGVDMSLGLAIEINVLLWIEIAIVIYKAFA
jgi:hypothetical protein